MALRPPESQLISGRLPLRWASLLIRNHPRIPTPSMTNIQSGPTPAGIAAALPPISYFSARTVGVNGGIISDRPWTRHPPLVSAALILLSPLARGVYPGLCQPACRSCCILDVYRKIAFDLTQRCYRGSQVSLRRCTRAGFDFIEKKRNDKFRICLGH